MRSWWIATGVALGAALVLSLGLTNWRIDPGRVRGDLAATLGPIEAPAAATLTLLPRPTLRLTNLRFGGAGGALTATATEALVTLRINRLLAGAFAPLGVTLRDAAFHIDLDAFEPALAGLAGPPVSQLIVERGNVEIFSARRGAAMRIDLAEARADWGAPDGALRASASGRWRGQPVVATVDLDTPLLALHGGVSPVRATLSATALAQLDLTGDWSPHGVADAATYRGQVTALIPSLERFARWMGWTPAPGPTPAGLELSARISADSRQAKLADAELKLGGQPFEGDLVIARTPSGVAASGTLAADALDVEALIGPPPALFEASGEWSKTPALPRPLPGLDLDLRISATRADWGGYHIDNAAAAVSQRDNRFAVKLLDSGFAHGSLTGEMWIDDRQGDCASGLSLSLENADLGALAAEFGARDFAGAGALKVSIRARGLTPADIVASADGEGSIEIADGVLRNVNFEEALRRAQRRLIDVARDMNAGATRVGSARGRIEISDGEARFTNVAGKAPGLSLSLTGAIDLQARAFRAQVTARQSAEDGTATPDGAHVDFALYGPWSGPVLAPLIPPAD